MSIHVVHFTASINAVNTGQFIDSCTRAVKQGASHLTVKIATMGGECSYGFSLYNFLRALPVPVHTHNLGTVESMGNIMFLAGQRRTACLHSKFLFHPFHWNLNGSVDHARISEYAMSLDRDLDLYARIVSERTQGAAERLDIRAYLCGEPRILEPTDALRCGLIDEIDESVQPADATCWSVPI
ncbi:ATP-dependent Clp protease proteolytic subunit [Stutzerimonas chloritidismutans]|uniref:ATP-dependent Clp protease proteolytic subunit n=1 Tax=Stutzerimonas chloritidismutans TaxID=203192 RepID=UPI003F186034